jgi:hypothetical protein
MRSQFLSVAVLVLCSALASRAGGPAFVAGSGYNPGVEGNPLIWANGSVQYFTNPAPLSPIVTEAQADALVAAAFSTWTNISGVTLTASQGGHLAEDVTGSNIEVNGEGVVTAPADITPSATGTPVGIVYDYDGTVTDAILGEGAGDLADCFTNAVYGGPDNFSMGGNIVHALVVINGVCASTSAQLPDVQYRLVRVLGRILGLGWSQANLNVQTRTPTPTNADFAGFSVMHFLDSTSCVPITLCYSNPSVPALDDTDALARLYPGRNPQATGRVYGSVYFTDTSGNAAQPMQGVNVVARLMVSDAPSRQFVVASVSGFLFCGNAGNIIDGYLDGDGLRYDRWGSDNPSVEGFYDLGQLPIPAGQTIAQYQISVEPLDPDWSMGVEPYAPTQVTPSGSFVPVVVTVSSGSNAERDILMLRDEIVQPHPGSGSTYASPAVLPQGGTWGSWISGYGSVDYFEFTAQANRTASVAVTAVDEMGQPTENKLLPVIGIWELSDQTGDTPPAATPSAFNTTNFAMTRLDAQFAVSESFRVGVADFRGDGRPDYFYQASLLYSDSVVPARVSLAGGVSTLNGIGFNPGQQVMVCSSISPDGSCLGGNNGATLSASASQIQAGLPPAAQEGTATIQVTDPVSGAFSQMIGALTYGASPTDLLLLLQGSEPATPVGSAAANPIRIRAVAADGVTPVSGATIAWSSTNGLQFSVCSGDGSCSVLSDAAGESSTSVTPTATGPGTITIALAPAVYSPPQSRQATVIGTSTTLDLAAVNPARWIAQGATISVPLTVEALDLGVPLANVTVNFVITQGTATLSASSATTNASGFATVTANLTNLNAAVQVSACVAPHNAPCQSLNLFSTPPSVWTLETVSGSSQFVLTGQIFQPLVMRVTDGSAADNPVMGVNVTFATTLARVSLNQGNQQNGQPLGGENGAENGLENDGVPVLLGSSQAQVVSAQDGTASILPTAGNAGPCDVFITVSAGAASAQFQMENLAAMVLQQTNNTPAPTQVAPRRARTQASAPMSTLEMLFAIPEGYPIVDDQDNPPAPDSHLINSAVSSTDDASGDNSTDIDNASTNPAPASNASAGSPASTPAESKNSSPSKESKPEEAQALQEAKARKEKEEVRMESGVASTEASRPMQADSTPSSWFAGAEEKRSCRALAGDGPFF